MSSNRSYQRFAALASLGAIVLSGCAAKDAAYPSLAIRPAERAQGSFEDVPKAQPPLTRAPLSVDAINRLAQLQAEAARAHRAFLKAAPGTSRLVSAASGAAIASDRWANAQVALADLESSRSQAAVPLGDLDLLFADAAVSLEQRDSIVEARDAVVEMIAEEDRILAGLRRKLTR